jgi:hypothetical protein
VVDALAAHVAEFPPADVEVEDIAGPDRDSVRTEDAR